MRFAHTNIVSTDWKKLADFYIKIFDCKMVPPTRNQSGEWLDIGTGLKNARIEGSHLLLPGHGENGPTLEIYQYTNTIETAPIMPNKQGYGHIAFEVDNVKTVLEQLVENGGQALGDITRTKVEGVGILTFIYARDPEGNLIELQHWVRQGK